MPIKFPNFTSKVWFKFIAKVLPKLFKEMTKNSKEKHASNELFILDRKWLENNDGKREYIIVHHSATKDSDNNDWKAIDIYHRSFRIDFTIIVAPYDGIIDNTNKNKYINKFNNYYDREQVEKFYNRIKRFSNGKDYYMKPIQGKVGNHYIQTPWRKIGYNIGIERENGIYKVKYGRNLKESGAHCYQQFMNKKSIGILFVGNYDKVIPSIINYTILIDVLKDIKKVFPDIKILGHREVKGVKKSCPGKYFDMDNIRKEVI